MIIGNVPIIKKKIHIDRNGLADRTGVMKLELIGTKEERGNVNPVGVRILCLKKRSCTLLEENAKLQN